MNRKMKLKGIAALFLSLALTVGTLPVGASAGEPQETGMGSVSTVYQAPDPGTDAAGITESPDVHAPSTITVNGRVKGLGLIKDDSRKGESSSGRGDGSVLRETLLPEKWDQEDFASYMPDLRDQQQFGTCWVQAVTGVIETYMIKHRMADRDLNLSETQLAFFCENRDFDPLGLTAGDAIAEHRPGSLERGGFESFAINTLANWVGVAEEYGDLVYPPDGFPEPTSMDREFAYEDDVAHLANAYILKISHGANADPSSSGFKAVKRAIMDNGSATIDFNAMPEISDVTGKRVYNKEHNAYYDDYDYNGEQNHAVMVVGWDDNFPKESFAVEPPGDGAWLIRNTWAEKESEAWSYCGYFWMSYYNASTGDDINVLEVDPVDKYDNNYQYDGATVHKTYSLDTEELKVANVFTAQASAGGEELKAISFFTANADVFYNVSVYVDDGDGNCNLAEDPESGRTVRMAIGNLPFVGYHTIAFDGVHLDPGQRFSVVVVLSKQGANVGTEAEITRNYGNDWGCTASIRPGESFVMLDNEWTDMSEMSGNSGNLCIKAFTKNLFEARVDLSSDDVDVHIMRSPYSGSALEPLVTVRTRDDFGSLISSSEYEVSYGGSNIWGDMSVTVTAKDGSTVCTGSKTCSYTILPADLALTKKYFIDPRTGRTGLQDRDGIGLLTISPAWTIGYNTQLRHNGQILTEGVDYEFSADIRDTFFDASNNRYINVPITGIGKFCGTKQVKAVIHATDISSTTPHSLTDLQGEVHTFYEGASIAYIPDQTYSPAGCKPAVTVTNQTRGVLTADVDYTVEYSGNTSVTGSAIAIVKGKGNYTGTKEATFSITPADIEDAVMTGIADHEYNGGNPVTIEGLTVKYEGYPLAEGTDYSIVWNDNTEPGTASFTITGKGNYTGSVTKTFEIKNPSASITDEPIGRTVTYTGESQDLITGGAAANGQMFYAVTKAGDPQPAPGAFSKTYPTMSSPGAYTVWYYAKGSGIYLSAGLGSVSAVIKRADNAPLMPSARISVPFTTDKVGLATLPEGWEWSEGYADVMLSVGEPLEAAAVYTGWDKDCYINTGATVTIERSACQHADTVLINKVEKTHTADGYTGDTYCSICKQVIATGQTVKAEGHAYGEPLYIWSDDHSTCTATAVCTNKDCGYVLEERSIANRNEIAATYTEKGIVTYTAYFKNPAFSMQKMSIDLPMLVPSSSGEGTAEKDAASSQSEAAIEQAPEQAAEQSKAEEQAETASGRQVEQHATTDMDDDTSPGILPGYVPGIETPDDGGASVPRDTGAADGAVPIRKDGGATGETAKDGADKGKNQVGDENKNKDQEKPAGNVSTKDNGDGTVTTTEKEVGINGESIKTAVTTDENGDIVKTVTTTVQDTENGSVKTVKTETEEKTVTKTTTVEGGSKTVEKVTETPGKKIVKAVSIKKQDDDGSKSSIYEMTYATGTVRTTQTFETPEGDVMKSSMTVKSGGRTTFSEEITASDGSTASFGMRTTSKGNSYIRVNDKDEVKLADVSMKSAELQGGRTVVYITGSKAQTKRAKKLVKAAGMSSCIKFKRVK